MTKCKFISCTVGLCHAVMSSMREVASAVKKLRAELGDTQAQFAERLGLSVRAVANYERNRAPNIEVLFDLGALAREVKKPALEQVFTQAVKKQLHGRTGPVTRREEIWVQALLFLVRNQHVVRDWRAFVDAFLRALEDVKQAASDGK